MMRVRDWGFQEFCVLKAWERIDGEGGGVGKWSEDVNIDLPSPGVCRQKSSPLPSGLFAKLVSHSPSPPYAVRSLPYGWRIQAHKSPLIPLWGLERTIWKLGLLFASGAKGVVVVVARCFPRSNAG